MVLGRGADPPLLDCSRPRRSSYPTDVAEIYKAEEESGKKKVGGAAPGWSGKRVVASTHDNSV